jgi:hypothetical protein
MTPLRMFLVAGGIAVAMAAAAPASAAVVQTSALWADTSAGAYHACMVTNTGSKPLGAGSTIDLVDSGGTVQQSIDISGLGTGQVFEGADGSTGGFESCKVTVAGSSKNIRANLTIFFFDGSKYLSLATDDAR